MKRINPGAYHGSYKEQSFFEGWYYKIDHWQEQFSMAIIVGISMNQNGEKEAFIQFVDGKSHRPRYYRFEAELFQASQDEFKVQLGLNFFSLHELKLDLPDLKAHLHFENHSYWSRSFYQPNIMGPLHYFKRLDCNHGILSLRNQVRGQISFNQQDFIFSQAQGYIEKDWGKSFPKAHIWLQSNVFSEPEVSLSVAIAKMSVLNREIIGYAAVLQHARTNTVFSNYQFSQFNFQSGAEVYRLKFTGARYRLDLDFELRDPVGLISPLAEGMKGEVKESINSEMELKLTDRLRRSTIIKTTGNYAGVEVAGEWS